MMFSCVGAGSDWSRRCTVVIARAGPARVPWRPARTSRLSIHSRGAIGPPPSAVPRAATTTATHELEPPSPCERIDVALRLGLVERVLRLDLHHQVVPCPLAR